MCDGEHSNNFIEVAYIILFILYFSKGIFLSREGLLSVIVLKLKSGQ